MDAGDNVPAYFPDKWRDDEFMSGIMSMMKDRSVNPLDYDKKMAFWRELIGKSCTEERSAAFSLDVLKRRFRRGNRLPACIGQVVENLIKEEEVRTLSEWRTRHATWTQWGMAKIGATTSWLFGGSAAATVAPDELIVHLPTVKKQADRVLDIIRKELEADIDGTGEVIGFSEMFEKCTGVVGNVMAFELVLDELTDRGELTVGESRGERVVKFRDLRSTGPVSFSESDASVHDIRRTMSTLEKKINVLERNIQKLDAECRAAIRAGEKTKAAGILRKKKAAEKELGEKDGQIQRMLTMLHQIGASKHNKEVIDAYKAGSAAFKATLERHGLSPDKIDETMDDVMNATTEFRDIEEAMAQPINGIHDAGRDADLEGELDALLAAEKKETENRRPIQLPEVPTGRIGLPDEEAQVDYNSLEQRLKRLQQAN